MYKLKGGMAFIEKYKNHFPMIQHNKSLDEIMAFGDEHRAAGNVPMVKLPSPTFGGELGVAWNHHEAADGGKLLIAIPTHIDALITDYHNDNEPEVPQMWESGCQVLDNKKRWLLWEKSRDDVRFNGTREEFIELFEIDDQIPDVPADDDPVTPPTDVTGGLTMHLVCPHCKKVIF